MTAAKKPAGKSIDEFRAAHDKDFIVPQKITAALEALGDSWEYELAFLKLAGLSTSDLAAYRNQFEKYIVETGGRASKRAWCGSPALATKLRAMV